MRRIFEPIPRPVAILAGVALIVLLLSPFWMDYLQGRSSQLPNLPSEDTGTLPLGRPSSTNRVYESPFTAGASSTRGEGLEEFLGIRLGATREELPREYNLQLLNTRGMRPEIYQATRVREVDQLTAHFYDDALKEFMVVLREQAGSPSTLEEQLQERFGPPDERVEGAGTTGLIASGLGLSAGMQVKDTGRELQERLAAYPHRRQLTWLDGPYQLEATIYYSSEDPSTCRSTLAVHASDVAWLEADRPPLGSWFASSTNEPRAVENLSPTNELTPKLPTVPSSEGFESPPRLFP